MFTADRLLRRASAPCTSPVDWWGLGLTMSSPLVRAEAPAPRQLRHPAELPFFVFMVVLSS
jgi:hypothetical protein